MGNDTKDTECKTEEVGGKGRTLGSFSARCNQIGRRLREIGAGKHLRASFLLHLLPAGIAANCQAQQSRRNKRRQCVQFSRWSP